MRLKFLHLHLHGLIRSKNLELGRDADTGGQTQYVLELINSLANISEVDQVDWVTRLINDPKVDDEYSQEEEFVERIRPCKCKCKNFNLIQKNLRQRSVIQISWIFLRKY